MLKTEGRLTCEAYMWSHQGSQLHSDDEHAFRYKVKEAGELIGYITADRSLNHPDVRWECSRVGQKKAFAHDYKTVEEALAAF
jgi:hypothetical protein